MAEGGTPPRATHFAIAIRSLERMLKGQSEQVRLNCLGNPRFNDLILGQGIAALAQPSTSLTTLSSATKSLAGPSNRVLSSRTLAPSRGIFMRVRD